MAFVRDDVALCGGGCTFLAILVIGLVVLRRRGEKEVTAREALDAGVESASGMFVRTAAGPKAVDDE